MAITQYNEPRQAEYVSQFVPFPFEMAYKVLDDQQKKFDEGKATEKDFYSTALKAKGDAIHYENDDKNQYIQQNYIGKVGDIVKQHGGDYRGVSNDITGLKNQFEQDPIVFHFKNRKDTRDASVKEADESKMAIRDIELKKIGDDNFDITNGKSTDANGNIRGYEKGRIYGENKDFDILNTNIFHLQGDEYETPKSHQLRNFDDKEGNRVSKLLSTSTLTKKLEEKEIFRVVDQYVDRDPDVDHRVRVQAEIYYRADKGRNPTEQEIATFASNKKASLKEYYRGLYSPQAYTQTKREDSMSGGIAQGDGANNPKTPASVTSNVDVQINSADYANKLAKVADSYSPGSAYKTLNLEKSQADFSGWTAQMAKDLGGDNNQNKVLKNAMKIALNVDVKETDVLLSNNINDLLLKINRMTDSEIQKAFPGNPNYAKKAREHASNYIYNQKIADQPFIKAVQQVPITTYQDGTKVNPNEAKRLRSSVEKLYDRRLKGEFNFDGNLNDDFVENQLPIMEQQIKNNIKNKSIKAAYGQELLLMASDVRKFHNAVGGFDNGWKDTPLTETFKAVITDDAKVKSVKASASTAYPEMNADGSIKNRVDVMKNFTDYGLKNPARLLTSSVLVNGQVTTLEEYVGGLTNSPYDKLDAPGKVVQLLKYGSPHYVGITQPDTDNPLVRIGENADLIIDGTAVTKILGIDITSDGGLTNHRAMTNLNGALINNGVYREPMGFGIKILSNKAASGYGKQTTTSFADGQDIKINVNLSKYGGSGAVIINNANNARRFAKEVEQIKIIYNNESANSPEAAKKTYNASIIEAANRLSK